MSRIRDVVRDLEQREGVEAVIVLGPDGVTIDAMTRDGVDAETLAASIPRALRASRDLGAVAARGRFQTCVVEYDHGLLVIAELAPEVILALSIKAGINVGPLLYDLRRNRTAMAALF